MNTVMILLYEKNVSNTNRSIEMNTKDRRNFQPKICYFAKCYTYIDEDICLVRL